MASCAPVEAPDGTAARPMEPSSSTTSTSTVGLPRLSRISRPMMSTMAVISKTFLENGGSGFGGVLHAAQANVNALAPAFFGASARFGKDDPASSNLHIDISG